MSFPLVVTKRYEGHRILSWRQPATQTNRDPNRDKTLARSNQPRILETYRCQDDVLGHEVQFLLSEVLPVYQNLNYKLQRRLSDVLPIQQTKKNDTILFSSSRRVTRRQVMRHFTSNGPDQCHNGSPNLLTSYREQPRSTRIVVAYRRPAFLATKRTNPPPISFDNKSKFLKATRHAKIRKIEIPKSMVGEALSWRSCRMSQRSAGEKPYASQKNASRILPVRRSLLALVGRKQTVVRDQLFTQKSSGSRL